MANHVQPSLLHKLVKLTMEAEWRAVNVILSFLEEEQDKNEIIKIAISSF